MKNKILTYMLAICMILPCLFMLTACNFGEIGEPGAGGGGNGETCQHVWSVEQEPVEDGAGKGKCSICAETFSFPALNDTDYETSGNVDHKKFVYTKDDYTFNFYISNFVVEGDSNGYFIIGYRGNSSDIIIPNETRGLQGEAPIIGIGANVFLDSNSITSVTISSGIREIASSAFSGCANLSRVELPTTLKEIDPYAFYHCFGLSNIILPSGLEVISASAFAGSGIVGVVIPDTVTQIGENAFDGCFALEKVVVGSGLTRLSARMFNACTSLEEVVLSSSVETIKEGAFNGCSSLEEIVWPVALTTVEGEAFVGCTSLDTVWYMGTKAQWNNNGLDSLFTGDGKGQSIAVDVYYYYETKPTAQECVYVIGSTYVWHYGGYGVIEVWGINVTSEALGKRYITATIEASVTDEYWTMLQQAKDQDNLSSIFGDNQEEIDRLTSSATKAEYEAKLSTIDFGISSINFDSDRVLIGSGWMPYQEIDKIVCVTGHTYVKVITFNEDMTEAYIDIEFENRTWNFTLELYEEE